jgi:hypothetical protein
MPHSVATAPQSQEVKPRRVHQPWKQKRWIGVTVLLALLSFISYCNVDRTLTDEDRQYIRLYLPGVPEGIAPKLSFEEQIKLIEKAQLAVHERTTGWIAIPEGQPREPKQLYLGRSGMCYDRSRVLEKIFTYLGFSNRHLAMFKREANVHSYETILFHHASSHAISEVLTKKGWLMVDSNSLWISLNDDYQPVSMPQLQHYYRQEQEIHWAKPTNAEFNEFYNSRCIALYGLYSRHGRFYPPYISGIPDYRLRGLLYNFEQVDLTIE